jgi:uncharacterized protein YdeI (YjbR/CyaY-like superfamily)
MTKPTYFATPAAFRSWLEANHATQSELVVGFYKTSIGKPSITWPESVDEALCFGWIDGVRRSLGDEAYSIRFTPRKATSIWSAINVAKIEALRAASKMRPAGEAAFAKRTDARTGVYSFERKETAVFSTEQARVLATNAKAATWFGAQAPWYQRTATHWVISAKQETTRERRLAELIRCCALGQRIGPLTEYKTAKTSNAASSSRATSTVNPASRAKPSSTAKPAKPKAKASPPKRRG